MATCLDIITNAMKLARIISPGETPDADEATDGMSCLQSLYDGWRIGGMFGRLEDVYLTADDTAKEGKRYYVAAGVTLTDATNAITDECGNTRQPRDLTMYEALLSDGTHSAKLYDRTGWVNLLSLAETDTAPLSSRGEMGLGACLALSGAFAAMFGDTATANPDVQRLAALFLASVSLKRGSTEDRAKADYF
jgi:hypothetical protein